MVMAGQMWFLAHPILVFFNSSASCYLIPDRSSASHSNPICINAPWDQYRELGSHHLYNQKDYITT